MSLKLKLVAFKTFLLFSSILIKQASSNSLADCEFNREANGKYTTCNYKLSLGKGHHCFSWEVCNGQDAHWRGGPRVDGSGSRQGGYVFTELSSMASYETQNKSRMAWFMTPEFPSTKAYGRCMNFQYNIKGLSAKALNIRLYDVVKNSSYVIWEKLDTTHGQWKKGYVSFTSENEYKVVFEAIPNSKNPLMRGHIAIDNIEVTDSACPGDCMFDSDICTWSNVNGTDELDFNMGRGSTNIVTGPTSDHTSQDRNGLTGGYVYLDSSFPKGPGDRALLISQQFGATDPDRPSCMRFWISVYGPGIGSLSVQLLDATNNTLSTPIWKLTSEKFDNSINTWHEARTTISYPEPFKVLIEAVVGESNTGDIGIDDISFLDGPCPLLPQIASVGNGQCSFLDECEWTVYPVVQELNTRPMWTVVYGTDTLLQPDGHTKMADSNRHDGYMRFWTSSFIYASLDASALVGPPIKRVDVDICIGLWVYMYSSSKSELGIGSLSILQHSENKNTTLWSLAGSQNSRWFYAQTSFRTRTPDDKISFLGIKGKDIMGIIGIDDIMIYPGNCTTLPEKAKTHEADCSFELGTCAWSVSPVKSGYDPRWTWMKPRKLNGPRLVRDHTFDVETDGFVFVEVLEAPNKIETELRSPIFSRNNTVCLTFYYAAYSSEDGAFLKVITRGGEEREWWNVTRAVHDAAAGRAVPRWQYGQVEIKNPHDFIIIFIAKVRISAFAIDDIKIRLGPKNCPTGFCCRPQVVVKNSRHSVRSGSRQGRLIEALPSININNFLKATTAVPPVYMRTKTVINSVFYHNEDDKSIQNKTDFEMNLAPVLSERFNAKQVTKEELPHQIKEKDMLATESASVSKANTGQTLNGTESDENDQISHKPQGTVEEISTFDEFKSSNASMSTQTSITEDVGPSSIDENALEVSLVDRNPEDTENEKTFLEDQTSTENLVNYSEPTASEVSGFNQFSATNVSAMFSEFFSELEQYSKKTENEQ